MREFQETTLGCESTRHVIGWVKRCLPASGGESLVEGECKGEKRGLYAKPEKKKKKKKHPLVGYTPQSVPPEKRCSIDCFMR